MMINQHLPQGAEPFLAFLDPDPKQLEEAIDDWQARQVESMEAEGITITDVDGGRFQGYYFPDQATPAYWLTEERLRAERAERATTR